MQILGKNSFFKFWTRMLVEGYLYKLQTSQFVSFCIYVHLFISKNMFSPPKTCFSGNKTLNLFFAEICITFLAFFLFPLFLHQNFEKAYFNQCLECAAPKCWLKYTTSKRLCENHCVITDFGKFENKFLLL